MGKSRPGLRAIAALVAVKLVVILTAWLIWLHARDPLPVINRDLGALAAAVVPLGAREYGEERRELAHITIVAAAGDTIRAALSLPESPPPAGIPAVVVLGGLEVGERTLGFVLAPGPNAVVVYEYPYHPEYWYDGHPLGEALEVRRSVLAVPGQVSELTRWLREQPWSDGRVSVLGYSFGALFVPAVHRVAQARALPLGPAVIAYGGADLHAMLRANLREIPGWLRPGAARLAATLVRPIEPALHLPHLEGEFLLINGSRDEQIPERCWGLQQRLLGEPRTVLVLDEGHMHFRKPELTARLVATSREWLAARGAWD